MLRTKPAENAAADAKESERAENLNISVPEAGPWKLTTTRSAPKACCGVGGCAAPPTSKPPVSDTRGNGPSSKLIAVPGNPQAGEAENVPCEDASAGWTSAVVVAGSESWTPLLTMSVTVYVPGAE